MIKNYASSLFQDWINTEIAEYLNMITKADSLVDLGCGDGSLTLKFAQRARSKSYIGVDSLPSKNKLKIVKANLNRKLPLTTGSVDCVLSHFSIEHLYNTGMFISESYRILKKGGYTLVATDNMASVANIISLLLGFQPFTTTMGFAQRAIGNPFALRSSGTEDLDSAQSIEWRLSGEYSHNKVLSYQGLLDCYKEHGFKIDKVIGVGYFPFKGFLSRSLAQLDKRHAHFLILKAVKL